MKPTRTAGHISIFEGAKLNFNNQLIEQKITSKRNVLNGFEDGAINILYTRYWDKGEISIYHVQGKLELHTDIAPDEEMTMGMILQADNDLILTTGRSHTSAKPGDIFTLDPNKRHGANTNGSLVFAATDYHKALVPSAGCYRQIIDREIDRIHRVWESDQKWSGQ